MVPSIQSPSNLEKGHLEEVLLTVFGHSKFREYQLEVMMKILQGQDVFCMMATGAGKSLTFQLPAVTCRRHGMLATSIVISPLLSLIEDQVMSLMSMGISAVAIGGGATREEEEAAMKGAYSIIYATPEKNKHMETWNKRARQESKNCQYCYRREPLFVRVGP